MANVPQVSEVFKSAEDNFLITSIKPIRGHPTHQNVKLIQLSNGVERKGKLYIYASLPGNWTLTMNGIMVNGKRTKIMGANQDNGLELKR